MQVAVNDIVKLHDGRTVLVTDVAEAPETIFVGVTHVDYRENGPFVVTDNSEVVRILE